MDLQVDNLEYLFAKKERKCLRWGFSIKPKYSIPIRNRKKTLNLDACRIEVLNNHKYSHSIFMIYASEQKFHNFSRLQFIQNN